MRITHRDVRPVDESGAACATALQSRRWWSEPGGTRSSAASSPWQRPRAEMVGAELAVGSRRSARQGGVEVGLGSSEDAPEWSAGRLWREGAWKSTKPSLSREHGSGSGRRNRAPQWGFWVEKASEGKREKESRPNSTSFYMSGWWSRGFFFSYFLLFYSSSLSFFN